MWNFFIRPNTHNRELQEAFARMNKQLKAVSGQLNFDLKIDSEGWMARCREIDGIVTGGVNKNPSKEEITQSVTDAIKTAFHIPISKLESGNKKLKKFPMIRVGELEFQLCQIMLAYG